MKKQYLFLTLLFVIALSALTSACSCAGPITAQESYDNADIVFTGTVMSVSDPNQVNQPFRKESYGNAIFQVKNTYKGNLDSEITLQTSLTSCDFFFEEEDEYLIFAKKSEETGMYYTWLCDGSTQLEYANEMIANLTKITNQNTNQNQQTNQYRCESNGGTYLKKANECEGISKESCTQIGGTFNECASACRNNPNTETCIQMCVQVCELKKNQENKPDLPIKQPGEEKEVPLPEVASQTARERLGYLGFTIVPKNITINSQEKEVYEVQGQKPGRFFGIFKMNMSVSAHIDKENGNVINEKKPWYAFLVAE